MNQSSEAVQVFAFKAFTLYDRAKHLFPAKVLVGINAGKMWTNEYGELRDQIKSYAQKQEKDYDWYKTANNHWVCSEGAINKQAYFCLMAQNQYPEESQSLLRKIIKYVESQGQYLEVGNFIKSNSIAKSRRFRESLLRENRRNDGG